MRAPRRLICSVALVLADALLESFGADEVGAIRAGVQRRAEDFARRLEPINRDRLAWLDRLEAEGAVALRGEVLEIADDPDAPMGTFVHWVLYDLSPDLTSFLLVLPLRNPTPPNNLSINPLSFHNQLA